MLTLARRPRTINRWKGVRVLRLQMQHMNKHEYAQVLGYTRRWWWMEERRRMKRKRRKRRMRRRNDTREIHSPHVKYTFLFCRPVISICVQRSTLYTHRPNFLHPSPPPTVLLTFPFSFFNLDKNFVPLKSYFQSNNYFSSIILLDSFEFIIFNNEYFEIQDWREALYEVNEKYRIRVNFNFILIEPL